MAYLGESIPKLGFGYMRLPRKEQGGYDMKMICDMVDYFMDNGFTYFDTAYVYDGGESEKAPSAVQALKNMNVWAHGILSNA